MDDKVKWARAQLRPLASVMMDNEQRAMTILITTAENAERLAGALKNIMYEHKFLLDKIGEYEDGHKILSGVADNIPEAFEALKELEGG